MLFGVVAFSQATIRLPHHAEVVHIGVADLGCQHGSDLFVVIQAPWSGEEWCDELDCFHLPTWSDLALPDRVGAIGVFRSIGDGRFASPDCLWPLYLEHESRVYSRLGQYESGAARLGIRAPTSVHTTDLGLLVFGSGWPQPGEMDPLHAVTIPVESARPSVPVQVNLDLFLHGDRPYELSSLRLGQGEDLVAVGNFDGRVGRTFAVIGSEAVTLPGVAGKVFPVSIWRLHDQVAHLLQTGLHVGQLGMRPQIVTVGDLTGNGFDDLVVACAGVLTDRMYIFLSNGDGTFRAVSGGVQTTESDPRAVLLGDLNVNGRADLLLIGELQSQVFLGQRNGTFTKGPSLRIGLADAGEGRALLADFDQDRRLDLVLVEDAGIQLYSGRGDGTFAEPAVLPLDSLQRMLQADQFVPSMAVPIRLDMVSDGPGLVVLSRASNEIAVLVNRGNGVLEPVDHPAVEEGITAVLSDSCLLVQLSSSDGIVSGLSVVADDHGALRVVPHEALHIPDRMAHPYDVAVNRLDDTGSALIAVCGLAIERAGVGVVGVVRMDQRGHAFSQDAQRIWQTVDVGLQPVQVEILHGGAGPRIVVLNAGSENLSILSYDRGRPSSPLQYVRTVQLSESPMVIASADIAMDVRDDLIVLYRDAAEVHALFGRTDYQQFAVLDLPSNSAAFGRPLLLALADVTGNGVVDLVVGDEVRASDDKVTHILRIIEGSRTDGEYRLARDAWTGELPFKPTGLIAWPMDQPRDATRVVVVGRAEPYVLVVDQMADGSFAVRDAEYRFLNEHGVHVPSVGLDGVTLVACDGERAMVGFRRTEQELYQIEIFSQGPPPPPPPVKSALILLDVAAGDVLGDGVDELVIVCLEESSAGRVPHALIASVERPDGASQPRLAQHGHNLALRSDVGRVLVGDVDLDGMSDIVVLYPREGRIDIHWGEDLSGETLRFSDPTTVSTSAMTGHRIPFSLQRIPSNEGALDEVLVMAGSSLVRINAGTREATVEPLPLGDAVPFDVAFTDLSTPEQTGLAVLARTASSSDQVQTFVLDVSSADMVITPRQIQELQGEPVALVAERLSAGMHADLFVAFRDRPEIQIICWEGGGPVDFWTIPRGQGRSMGSLSGSIISDDVIDLAVMAEWSSTMTFFSIQDGSLIATTASVPDPRGGLGTRMAAANLCSRGTDELLIWTSGGHHLSILSMAEDVSAYNDSLIIGSTRLDVRWGVLQIVERVDMGPVRFCVTDDDD